MYKNFISDFLTEGLLIDDVDDYVEYWHNHDVEESLSDFLGLTEYEYEAWMKEGNDILRDVLYCRRHGIDFLDYGGMSTGEKIAARSYNLKEVREYKKNGK